MEMQLQNDNPFELFPKEIWVMILDKVEDSKDILNSLRVMPLLDITISKPKRYWYIGQILPFITNLIDLKDVLNLRLVCKTWKLRVDLFLQNQPYFRAYSEEFDKDHPNFWAYLETFQENAFRGIAPVIRTDTDGLAPSVLDEILRHPRNPLVFREIFIDIRSEGDYETRQTLKMLAFLHKFGSQVWYLIVKMGERGFEHEFLNLVRVLRLTLNLKRIRFHFGYTAYIPGSKQCTDKDLMERRLPDLPFLETVEVFCEDLFPCTLSRSLLKRYGPQLRRCELPEKCWDVKEMKNLLPNLTEMNYSVSSDGYGYSYGDEKDFLQLRNVLCGFPLPNLTKLQIQFCHHSFKMKMSIEKDVLELLKRFPHIKFLELDIPHSQVRTFLEEGNTADPVLDCIPSLQTLKISDGPNLSYNFLRCFPSLRDLQIESYPCPTVTDLSMPGSQLKLREHIESGMLYESNIWEVIRKLKSITLVGSFERKLLGRFYRETYEKLKKGGRIPTQFQCLRQDIVDFLASIHAQNFEYGENYYDYV